MSLKFIYGTASYDHLDGVADEVINELNRSDDQSVYYLVPNHIKFQSEVQLLQKVRDKSGKEQIFAANRLQILSFTRLTWFFLKNAPIYQYPRLTSSSMNMLLYRIIQDHADELTLFSNVDMQFGLVSKIASQINDLKIGNVNPDDLSQVLLNLVDSDDTDLDLVSKVHDLNIIYSEFAEETENRFIDNSDIVRALCEQLSETDLSGNTFVISGFANFSAEETKLINTLIESKAEVIVDLVTDEIIKDPAKLASEDLFFETKRVGLNFLNYAKQNTVKIENEVKLSKNRASDDLQKLERFWIDSTKGLVGERQQSELTHVRVNQANSRYSEVENVATEIRQSMAVDEKLKYKDFAVVTRHLSEYDTIIPQIFKEFEIPIFYDLQISMKDHPLVELVRSLFAVKKSFYQYEDVMRLLKTGLLIPEDTDPDSFTAELDVTENYLLQMGIRGRDWLSKNDWQVPTYTNQLSDIDQYKQVSINHIKSFVSSMLVPFYKRLDSVENGAEAAQVLYQFLIEYGVDQRLIGWSDDLIETGDLAQAAQSEQTWETFIQMLDEYVEILGSHDFKPDEFIGLLNAGFESASYSQIPSTLDQVSVSEMGMVQMADRKRVFIIGATDRNMPEQPTDNSFFNEDGQKEIESNLNDDQFLSLSPTRLMQFEPFLNYTNFLMGSEELVFSFPLRGNDGEDLTVSPYVERIINNFNIKLNEVQSRPHIQTVNIERFIGSQRSTLSHLVQYARDAKQSNQTGDPNWNFVYQQLLSSDYQYLTNQLLSALKYKNVPTKLQPEIVEGLYGNTIYASVSKLEEFFKNEYEYFLKYGLKLQERPSSEITPANTGEYFHASFDDLVKELNQQKIDFSNLNDSQIGQIATDVVEKLRGQSEFQYFSKSNRNIYLQNNLDQTITEMTKNILKQMMRTRMRPIASEQLFGQIGGDAGLPALNFAVGPNRQVTVRGKIDRIDQIITGDDNYLGVVDYKSSDHKFDFGEAYNGLAMQMLVYLDVVKQNSQLITGISNQKLASALYMTIKNPLLKLKDIKDFNPDVIREQAFSENRLNGLILNDDQLLSELDPSAENKSDIYPLKFKRDGSIDANTQKMAVTDAELQLLMEHAEKKIIEAGTKIFAGELDLNPYRKDDKDTALQNSAYTDIMQFDAMLPENNYREIKNYNRKEIMELLKKENEDNG